MCEPIVRVSLETPADTIGAVIPALRASVLPSCPVAQGELSTVETLPARVPDLQRQLPGLSSGEGVLESSFAGYLPVNGDQPTRRSPKR